MRESDWLRQVRLTEVSLPDTFPSLMAVADTLATFTRATLAGTLATLADTMATLGL